MSFFGEIEEARAFMKLPPLITAKELKKRYKELSKKMHPDCGGDEESMSKLSKSYKLLLGYMENYRFKLTRARSPLNIHLKITKKDLDFKKAYNEVLIGIY